MTDSAYLGGVRTLDALRNRCFCDPDTGCWNWRMATGEGGCAAVFLVYPDGSRAKTTGRRAAVFLATGVKVPVGHIAWAKACCKSAACVNPDHVRVTTKKAWGANVRRTGSAKTPTKIAAALRVTAAHRVKYSDAVCNEIRCSDEPIPAIAARLGVNERTAYNIRLGISRRCKVPTSVFTWGGAHG